MAFKLALLISSLFLWAHSTLAADGQCLYNVVTQTNIAPGSVTSSNVSIKLYNQLNDSLTIRNLADWGLSLPPYFQTGNLDAFGEVAACLNPPICAMYLELTPIGPDPNWDVYNVTVRTIQKEVGEVVFPVNHEIGQHNIFNYTVDLCPLTATAYA